MEYQGDFRKEFQQPLYYFPDNQSPQICPLQINYPQNTPYYQNQSFDPNFFPQNSYPPQEYHQISSYKFCQEQYHYQYPEQAYPECYEQPFQPEPDYDALLASIIETQRAMAETQGTTIATLKALQEQINQLIEDEEIFFEDDRSPETEQSPEEVQVPEPSDPQEDEGKAPASDELSSRNYWNECFIPKSEPPPLRINLSKGKAVNQEEEDFTEEDIDVIYFVDIPTSSEGKKAESSEAKKAHDTDLDVQSQAKQKRKILHGRKVNWDGYVFESTDSEDKTRENEGKALSYDEFHPELAKRNWYKNVIQSEQSRSHIRIDLSKDSTTNQGVNNHTQENIEVVYFIDAPQSTEGQIAESSRTEKEKNISLKVQSGVRQKRTILHGRKVKWDGFRMKSPVSS